MVGSSCMQVYNKQINKRIQQILQMIHTFSPNWYKPQCLLFDCNDLYYASNYVLYKFNLELRKVEADKCFRKIALSSGMNSKDIKIHTICKLSKEWLIVGTNQPHAVLLNAKDFTVLGIIRNLGISQAYLCQTGYDQQQKLCYSIFSDETGNIVKINIQNPNDYKIKIVSDQKLPKQKPKQIIKLGTFDLIIFNRGLMALLDKHFEHVIQLIEPQKIGLDQQYVLSLDTWEEKQIIWACMLTRSKNNNTYIHVWSIIKRSQIKQESLQVLFKEIVKSQVKVFYPKSLNQKIKNAQKAAMVVKFINNEHILLTGKLGEIFILNLKKCPQSLIIKPHSLEEIPNYLSILDDSKHYKEIYAAYFHFRPQTKCPQLYTVSTDQTMNVWSIDSDSIQPIYCIKFVTAELTSIFYSQADPKTIFFLLKDSIIRSAAPLSNQNYFLNQYWKFTKKFKVVKAVAHPFEPGITAMVTDQNKIIIYDLFDDRLMKIMEIKDENGKQQIINITYERATIMEPIKLLTSEKEKEVEHCWKKQNIKVNRLYSKPMKNADEVGLLVQQKNGLIFIRQVKENEDEAFSIKRVCRLERIHNTKLWDGNSLVMSQYKNNSLQAWVYWGSKIFKLSTDIKLGGRCIFKIENFFLRVLEYKAKKVCTYSFSLHNQLKMIDTLEIDLPIHIEQSVLDYYSCHAAFYNGKDDILVVLKFGQTEAKVFSYQVGNKIESLTFYFSDYVVAGFKDQSLKLLKIIDLPSLKDQPQKKVKKTIDSHTKMQSKPIQQVQQSFNIPQQKIQQ